MAEEGNGLHVDRRTALRIGVFGGLAAASLPLLEGCAAAAPVAAAIGSSWFADMTAALAAGLLTFGAEKALEGAWTSWQEGVSRALNDETTAGHSFSSQEYCGDAVPPALMFASALGENWEPATDRLIVCVNGGAEYVAFDPWAWKALYLFIDDLTKSKEGDVLAGYQALCRISLIPNAVLSTNTATESGRSQLLTYATRNGEVEMNRRTDADGNTVVQVVATGIPSASASSTTREFTVSE